jgi:hypothetical protein
MCKRVRIALDSVAMLGVGLTGARVMAARRGRRRAD